VAVLVGALAGFLWWGLPAGRIESELRDARTSADSLAQQLHESRAENQRLEAQAKGEKARADAAERELRREKELNSRLHMLISKGKK
jgi:hypothetical protein